MTLQHIESILYMLFHPSGHLFSPMSPDLIIGALVIGAIVGIPLAFLAWLLFARLVGSETISEATL
jgi:hypothetical protein